MNSLHAASAQQQYTNHHYHSMGAGQLSSAGNGGVGPLHHHGASVNHHSLSIGAQQAHTINASPTVQAVDSMKTEVRKMVYEYLVMEGLGETFTKMQVSLFIIRSFLKQSELRATKQTQQSHKGIMGSAINGQANINPEFIRRVIIQVTINL